jgi:hypothetical protein
MADLKLIIGRKYYVMERRFPDGTQDTQMGFKAPRYRATPCPLVVYFHHDLKILFALDAI